MAITVDDVVKAITTLRDHHGSSRQALVKYFKVEHKIAEPAASLKKALDAGVKDGTLIQA